MCKNNIKCHIDIIFLVPFVNIQPIKKNNQIKIIVVSNYADQIFPNIMAKFVNLSKSVNFCIELDLVIKLL